jgi:hypothetical protein
MNIHSSDLNYVKRCVLFVTFDRHLVLMSYVDKDYYPLVNYNVNQIPYYDHDQLEHLLSLNDHHQQNYLLFYVLDHYQLFR